MNANKHRLAKWIGGIVTVGAVVLLVVVVSERRSGQRPPVPVASISVVSDSPVVQPAVPVPAPKPPAPQPAAMSQPMVSVPAADSVQSSAPPAELVRVSPGAVLAVVNRVELTLKDLMPLPPEESDTDHTLTAERYGFLLNRAIEREVTMQAARAQAIELRALQRRQLEQLRARSERTEPGVFDTVQQNPANTDFELRDATGLLLQAALAEKGGVPSPHVTTVQVQAYYQQHSTEYSALPAEPVQRAAVWERIDRDIRLKLAAQVQAEHQVAFQQFLTGLLAKAQITKPPL